MIKYRAWDTYHKKWIKHFYITENGLIYNMQQMHRDIIGAIPIENSGLIVMQSTGLFDKKGQEIFEGDLLDMSDPTENILSSGNPILEVRFNGLEFTVKGDIENGEMSFREFKEICELAGIPLKVIGNIHENRDLLEDL